MMFRLGFPAVTLWAVGASAHPGGLDTCGGHEDGRSGRYHTHNEEAFCLCEPEAARCVPDPPSEGNQTVTSFSRAKKLAVAIYDDHPVTFYCGCGVREGHHVAPGACGYRPKGKPTSTRTKRIEWEHVVPASLFGETFRAWTEGDPACVSSKGKPYKGRRCAGKVSEQFRLMEADLYNLVPAIGELNGARSNFDLGVIPGEAREFGACDFEVRDRLVEPREAVRGDVARIYLYMDEAYPGRRILTGARRDLLQHWAAADPVDPWECERARRIEEIQGNPNRVIQRACRAAARSAAEQERE